MFLYFMIYYKYYDSSSKNVGAKKKDKKSLMRNSAIYEVAIDLQHLILIIQAPAKDTEL